MPDLKSSYWVRVLEKPSPSTISLLPSDLKSCPAGEGDQHHDQRDVEEQVARPRADSPSRRRRRPPAGGRGSGAAFSSAQRGLADLLGLGVGAPGACTRAAGSAARGARRPAAQLADELPGARHDAADERDEQQDVDRREPHRAVDVEEPELVVDRRERGVRLAGSRATLSSSTLVCGMSEPGIAPSDSRKSRISATRIEVSCRQNQRAQPTTPSAGSAQRRPPAAPWTAASRRRRGPPSPVGRSRRRLVGPPRRCSCVWSCSWIRSPP